MDLGIEGKVAIVTGGSRGLGRYSALALAREGAYVAICGRDESTLVGTTEELNGITTAMGVVIDITDEAGPTTLFDRVKTQLGSVDILVNNVGGSRGTDALSTTDDEWRSAFDLNIMGALRLMRLVVPEMKERNWGRIVNISSIYGREHGGRATYMTAKAGLIALTKHMALDLAKDGVLVNSIAPGSIAFPGGSWERFQNEQPEEVVQEFIARNLPMEKFGWPEPIADTVAFLSSERASLITGATVNVDGGQSHSLI
ncbi:MAG: SDR family oxidoreductase [SAR202 cluster bacterium]|nr:SDR family oxidoreductase [SAR202 cluster bacterium]|tara:strand:- start:132 stop:902 length:771 start_codon:yes stop_codon:yes gene_type:complete